MEKIFKLKENGTTARTEIVAGLTTFMTMAYIIALNPNLLTNFATGTPLWNAVFMATCIASAIGMLVMAFAANKPFAMAPGMGLNSFRRRRCKHRDVHRPELRGSLPRRNVHHPCRGRFLRHPHPFLHPRKDR